MGQLQQLLDSFKVFRFALPGLYLRSLSLRLLVLPTSISRRVYYFRDCALCRWFFPLSAPVLWVVGNMPTGSLFLETPVSINIHDGRVWSFCRAITGNAASACDMVEEGCLLSFSESNYQLRGDPWRHGSLDHPLSKKRKASPAW
jgi:hypothetical protein